MSMSVCVLIRLSSVPDEHGVIQVDVALSSCLHLYFCSVGGGMPE